MRPSGSTSTLGRSGAHNPATMNVLGMGPMELLLILVVALIVFGPGKLPEIMGQVGKAVNDFRKATSELTDEFNRTIQTEVQQTRAAVEGTPPAQSATPAPPLVSAPEPASTESVGVPAATPLATADQEWHWEGAEAKSDNGQSGEAPRTSEHRKAGPGSGSDLLPPY